MNAPNPRQEAALLRPHPRDEQELKWFFNDAMGALGLKSGFPAMILNIQAPMSRGNTIAADIGEHLIAAASRERFILRTFERVARKHYDVLWAAYRAPELNETSLPYLAHFGELGAVVRDSPLTAQVHARSRSTKPLLEWLARIARPQASPTAKSQAAEVRRDAERRLAEAGRAYAAAKREVLKGMGRRRS